MNSETFPLIMDYLGPFLMTAFVIGGILGFAIGAHMFGDKKQ